MFTTDTAAWTTGSAAYAAFDTDRKRYTTEAATFTSCGLIETARATAVAACTKPLNLGGAGYVVATAPTTKIPESKDTKYACLHKAHKWTLTAGTTVTAITDTLAKAATVTTNVI